MIVQDSLALGRESHFLLSFSKEQMDLLPS